MKKLEKQSIEYTGFSSPENIYEIEAELAGLEYAVSVAQQRMALLKQTIQLVRIKQLENQNAEPKK